MDFNKCLDSEKLYYDSHMKHSLINSHASIFQYLDKLEESRSTCLGPALLTAVGMASKAPHGASIILCTDGLANRGLGSLAKESEDSKHFYNKLGNFANENSIMINITTIKGDECKIDVLAGLTDCTDGNINRVNPDDLSQNFQNIIKEEILANKVEIKLFLHKALVLRKFYAEEFQLIEGKYYKKVMGNITEKS